MKKLTAIEWLIEQLENHNGVTRNAFENVIQQAKAIEKEQIIDAFFEGKNDGILMERYSDYEHITPYEYYNKTFKSE